MDDRFFGQVYSLEIHPIDLFVTTCQAPWSELGDFRPRRTT